MFSSGIYILMMGIPVLLLNGNCKKCSFTIEKISLQQITFLFFMVANQATTIFFFVTFICFLNIEGRFKDFFFPHRITICFNTEFIYQCCKINICTLGALMRMSVVIIQTFTTDKSNLIQAICDS